MGEKFKSKPSALLILREKISIRLDIRRDINLPEDFMSVKALRQSSFTKEFKYNFLLDGFNNEDMRNARS